MLDAVEITQDGLIERVHILPQKRDHLSILNKVNRKTNRNSGRGSNVNKDLGAYPKWRNPLQRNNQ